MFEKLFGWRKKKGTEPALPPISFGRYSDNNKSPASISRWAEAEAYYKEKKLPESINAFFDYIRDDTAQNVVYERNGAEGRFELFQGSKIVRGHFDGSVIRAEATLARMPQASVPVMRRLLEMNFSLYYCRFALDGDRLCMRFDSDVATASPSKLYYGLKELAIKADKQDDLLLQDFAALQSFDTEHLEEIPAEEKEIKYRYLQQWITETLDMVATLDVDKFSGAIAYLLLSLIYRIDFLITPEGKLLYDLEKITAIYFKKDERPAVEKSRDMITAFQKLQAVPKDEVFNYLFRSKYTFSIVAPQPFKSISETIHAANQNMLWYKENNYPGVAAKIIEYGIAYCQYSYSMPRAITELFQLFMMVNYSDYFAALGFPPHYVHPPHNSINGVAVIEKIKSIQSNWKEKYPLLDFKVQNLRFDSLLNFNLTFTNEIEFLNMETQ